MRFEVRVRLPHRYVEIGIEGDFEEVLKAIDYVSLFTGEEYFKSPTLQQLAETPIIRFLGTWTNTILELLRKWDGTPKTFAEIREALTLNGLHIPRPTLQGVLSHLVSQGKLERWKDPSINRYVYTIKRGE